MAVYLVARRLKEGVGIERVGGGDVARADNPDAHALQTACVDVARMFERHACVDRMQATDVLVLKTGARADKDFK
jgi:hypothetical protein